MSRLGRVPPSAGRDVIDRKACFLSLLAQAAVWLLELRVSRTFLDQLRLQLLRLWIPNSRSCQYLLPRSNRFRLLELGVSRTFLDFLRLICSVHEYPTRRAAFTADPGERGAWSEMAADRDLIRESEKNLPHRGGGCERSYQRNFLSQPASSSRACQRAYAAARSRSRSSRRFLAPAIWSRSLR